MAILERRLQKTTSQKEKVKIERKMMSLLRVSSQTLFIKCDFCCRNNVSWFGYLQETWLGNNVSWFVHLRETRLGNNVSWFVHLRETWLANNVTKTIFPSSDV